MKKKIGIFWENFEYGGVENYLITLINGKEFQDCEFTIFTNSTNKVIKNFKKNFKKKPSLNVVLYSSINQIIFRNLFAKILFFLLKPFLFFFSLFQIFYLLKNKKFDIFLAQCGGFGDFRTDFASIIIAKILNFPIRSAVIHHNYSKPKLWSRTINIVNFFIAKLCSSLIFVSRATFNDIKKNTYILKNKNVKLEIIHNGITIKKVKKKKKLIIKNRNIIYALVLSRLEYGKGHLDLVEAFKYLSNRVKKKYLVYFIGKGNINFIEELKNKIKNLFLQNNFIFTGYLNKDSREIIANFDLLISPTREFEGFGLSIAESLSVGTPVISTKVGGVLDYLNKNNSILIKAKNPKLIADSLELFLNNKNKYRKKALIGKKTIQNYYSANIMTKKYFSHFQKFEIKNTESS